MASKPTPLDQPSRRTVEQLLRELAREAPNPYQLERSKLEVELRGMRERLLSDPNYIEMEKRLEELYELKRTKDHENGEKIAKVRRLYQSEGITERVKLELKTLVDDFNFPVVDIR